MRGLENLPRPTRLPERLQALEELAYNIGGLGITTRSACFGGSTAISGSRRATTPLCRQHSAGASGRGHSRRGIARAPGSRGGRARATTWRAGPPGIAETFGACVRPPGRLFSMEFGLTECLPIYSGGLGILAGDHLSPRASSGSLIGVGLLYQKGYFRQYLTGRRLAAGTLPGQRLLGDAVRPLQDERGQPVRIHLDLAGRSIAFVRGACR